MFINGLKETLNEEFNYSVTENGALGYRTTGKELLDINFAVTSMRSWDDGRIADKFARVFFENRLLAIKWLFYARDAREGIGERRLFRIALKDLGNSQPDICRAIVPLVPEYGRWDDLWCLIGSRLHHDVLELVAKQLSEDIQNMKDGKPISLLAKWMPSTNTSSKETRKLAKMFVKAIGVDERTYRKLLSKLRAYLKVVEVNMSKKEWSAIDYSAVPSRANLIYNKAFLRNDEERRREYLGKLQKGEAKINASVLFPHDIVHKYTGGGDIVHKDLDITIEELWKALPDYVQGAGNVICVADGSGSMTSSVGGTKVSALDVANALAIYFAERSSGQFKDTYITFSERPQLVYLSRGKTLREKIEIALRHDEVANTNIEAVFELILTTAVKNGMKQEDLPQTILILSDMEFDGCARMSGGGEAYTDWFGRRRYCLSRPDKRLFEVIAQRYAEHGYKLPRLVFWNICSRTGTIPVKENDLGVALVSGFSPAIVKMVLSNSTDPFECLLEQLNSERYSAVEEAVKQVI